MAVTPYEAMKLFKDSIYNSIDLFLIRQNKSITLFPIDSINITLKEIEDIGTPEQKERVAKAKEAGRIILDKDGVKIVVKELETGKPTTDEDYERHFVLQLAHPKPYIKLLGCEFTTLEHYNLIKKYVWDKHNESQKITHDNKKISNDDKNIVQKKPGRPSIVDPTSAYEKNRLWETYLKVCQQKKLLMEKENNFKKEETYKILCEYKKTKQAQQDWKNQQITAIKKEYEKVNQDLERWRKEQKNHIKTTHEQRISKLTMKVTQARKAHMEV